MARAPRPGSTPNATKAKRKDSSQRQALKIHFDGEDYVLDFADIGPQDDLMCRRATGLPISPFLEEETFSADSIAVMVWVAMRKGGHPVLKWSRFSSDIFPKMLDLPEWLENGRISIESIEDDEDTEEDEHPLE